MYKLQKNAIYYQFILTVSHVAVISDSVAVTVQYISTHLAINDPEHFALTESQCISEL